MRKPKLEEMTLREKISQCLVGYQSAINRRVEEDFSIIRSEEEKAATIRREQFGTLWAQTGHIDYDLNKTEYRQHKENSAVYRDWIKRQDDCLKYHAFLATDLEGTGAGAEFEDLTTLCGPMAIAATDSEELAYEMGKAVAREVKCAGVNWRWAPVLDIGSRYSAHIMRTYAPDDPERMVRIANAQIRGMQEEKVAATAKHFPGADRYEYRDSHFTPTKISLTMDEWWAEQGKVFQQVIDGGVWSVMVGHIAFPAADDTIINDQYIPASVSKKIVTDLLKGKMGFQGVAICDALGMGGLTSVADYDDLIIMLLQAGIDVLIGTRLHAADLIEKAIADGRLTEARINDACQRILDLKEKLGLFDDDYVIGAYKAEDVTPHTRQLNMEVARKSVTLVKDRKNRLPFDSKQVKHVTIICSTQVDYFFDELNHMKEAFERRGATVSMQRRLTSELELRKISAESDLIVYAAYIAGHEPKGAPSFSGAEMDTFCYAFAVGKEKSIGVSLGYPFIHYDFMDHADMFVNLYGRNVESMEAFVEAVYGEIPFVGKSPVKLEPDRRMW